MGARAGFYRAGHEQQVDRSGDRSCKKEPVRPKDCEISSKTEEVAEERLQEEAKVSRPVKEKIIAGIKKPSSNE